MTEQEDQKTELETNLLGPFHSVQVRDADYQLLKKMAEMYPQVRMAFPSGEAVRTGKVGVSHTEMIGHCITWLWEALRDMEMRPGR